MNATRWRGFTLIEVLVAVFIFALLMLAGYGSINALLRTRDGLADQNGRLRDLQFAVGLLERDLRSALARPVREGYGAREPVSPTRWRRSVHASNGSAIAGATRR